MKETDILLLEFLFLFYLYICLPGIEQIQLLRRGNRSVTILQARKTDQGDWHFYQSFVFSRLFCSNAFSYFNASVNNFGQP